MTKRWIWKRFPSSSYRPCLYAFVPFCHIITAILNSGLVWASCDVGFEHGGLHGGFFGCKAWVEPRLIRLK